MRSESKIWANGEKRIRTAFLFLPRSARVGDHWHTRWLEKATWEEKRICGWGDDYWATERWIDEGDEI